MLLDLSLMHGDRDRIDRTLDGRAFDRGDDQFRVASAVRLAFDVFRDGTTYRLVGQTGAELELTCSRCLETFRLPVDAPFDLLYLPHAKNTGEGEIEVEDEDLNTAYYRDEEIDLGQLVREQFYLALPMKPLCRDGCRGLCPECGTNLNMAECRCQRAWVNPRLEGLRSLVRDDKGGKG